jgi:hypothetical protein
MFTPEKQTSIERELQIARRCHSVAAFHLGKKGLIVAGSFSRDSSLC